ncbi:hypothetical protein KKA08_07365 [bacterium]|nr:hypothetical protein [bacterium]
MWFESAIGTGAAYLVNILIFMTINLLIVASSYRILIHFFYTRQISARFLKLIILMLTQIVLVHTYLAFAVSLTYLHVILSFCIIAFLLFALTPKRKRPPEALSLNQEIRLYVKSVWSLAASSRFTALISLGIIAYFIGLLFTALQAPLYNTDVLFYHFPIPVAIAKSHSLFVYPQWLSYDHFFYTINANYLILWSLLPFDSDFLARFFEVPFPFFIMLCFYTFLRKLMMKKDTAFLLSLLTITAPWMLRRSIHLSGVDGVFTLLLMSSIVFLYIYFNRPSTSNAVFLALNLGLLSGTKLLALSYMLGIVVSFGIYYVWKLMNREKDEATDRITIPEILWHLLIFMLGFLILSGTVLLRNFLSYGSPIFPIAMPFIPGSGGLNHPVAIQLPAFYYQFKLWAQMGNLFQIQIGVIGFSILAIVVALLRRRKSPVSGISFIAVSWGILFMWIGFAIYPFWTQHLRYYMGILFASIMIMAVVLPFESVRYGKMFEKLTSWIITISLIFTAGTFITNEFFGFRTIAIALGIGIVSTVIIWLLRKQIAMLVEHFTKNRKNALLDTSIVVILAAIISMFFYMDYPRIWRKAIQTKFHPIYSWIDCNTVSDGKNILVLNYEELNLFFYGVELQNNVLLFPRYTPQEWTEEQFLQFLNNQKINWVYYNAPKIKSPRDALSIALRYADKRELVPGTNYYPPAFSWIEENSNLFKELTRVDDACIFEYSPEELSGELSTQPESNSK